MNEDSTVTNLAQIEMTDPMGIKELAQEICVDPFSEQATAKELYALQDQIDEVRRIATANKIIAKLQQKTIDLSSERLDKIMEYIKCL